MKIICLKQKLDYFIAENTQKPHFGANFRIEQISKNKIHFDKNDLAKFTTEANKIGTDWDFIKATIELLPVPHIQQYKQLKIHISNWINGEHLSWERVLEINEKHVSPKVVAESFLGANFFHLNNFLKKNPLI